MKRVLALSLIFVLIMGACLSGCGDKPSGKEPAKDNTKIEADEGSGDKNAGPEGNMELDGETVNDDSEAGDAQVNKPDKNQSENADKKHPEKPVNNSGNNNSNGKPVDEPVSSDPMKWPANEYTNTIPKPANGVVEETGTQDGIFSLLLTGTDMGYAKEYAATLINAGFTQGITESNDVSSYTFGGGNSAGVFVVVSYDSGRFMIGIQK